MSDETAAKPHLSSRRGALSSALVVAAGLALPVRVEAAPPRVTRQVQLSIQIGEVRTLQASNTGGVANPSLLPQAARREEVTLGLYGEASPAYVELFQQVCTDSVPGEPDVSFRGLRLSRVERGRIIEFGNFDDQKVEDITISGTGYVRRKVVPKKARFVNVASSGLSHNRAGLVSMRRDGLANDFLVTTGADPSLDAEYEVIGEVLSGMSVIEEIDQIPTVSKSAVSLIGGTAALYGLRGGLGLSVALWSASQINVPVGIVLGCATAAGLTFVGDDPRDQEDTQFKPLTKVKLASATLL